MKSYDVCLPLTGKIYVTVEAESERDAIKKAFCSEELLRDNIVEWEVCEMIVEGNVFHGLENRAHAELAFGEED